MSQMLPKTYTGVPHFSESFDLCHITFYEKAALVLVFAYQRNLKEKIFAFTKKKKR